MQNLYQKYRQQLATDYTPHEIGLVFRSCVEEVCLVPYQQTYFLQDIHATAEQYAQLESILQRLVQHEPLQYVLGKVWFANLTFKVTPSVLIPRPETAELVQLILDDCAPTSTPLQILDVGTGSGCIAISLAHALPVAEVTAVDISAKALAVARENAQLNGVRLQTLQLDFLHSKEGINHSFDILVSNPPYIVPSEKTQMEANVLDYEPSTALFVPEDQPLLFYDELADFAQKHVPTVYLEVNRQFAQQTAQAFENRGFMAQVLDDSFGNPRFVKATR